MFARSHAHLRSNCGATVSRYALLALVAVVALAAGCKKSDPPAPAAAAGVGDKAAAAAAAAAAAVVAEPVKVEPPPADITLEAGDKVVAWLSLRSVNATFDAVESLAGKLGAGPPGASLRQAAFEDLNQTLAAAKITGHEWLAKDRAIHVVFQDDDAANPMGGVAIVLPVTDKTKAIAALTGAKALEQVVGHDLTLELGTNKLLVDFVGTHAVLSVSPTRFAACKAFVTRLQAVEVPSMLYVGLSIKDAAASRSKEIDALFASLEQAGAAGDAAGGAAMDYYARTMRDWLQSLERLEVLVDANVDDLQLAMRLHMAAGSKLATQINASRGRNALPVAASLPANAYLAVVGSIDPKANAEQVDDSLKMLGQLFQIEPAQVDELKGDFRSAMEKQDGTSGLAAYPDGDAAFGMLAFAGASDPEAVVKIGKKVVSLLLIKAIEAEEQRGKAADPKAAPDPKLAIVKRALGEMKVDPLIEAFGPIAKEAGVTVTANKTAEGGISCEVTDLGFDWAKIKASSEDEDVERAAKVIGPRTALALCTGKDRLVFTVGPSAFEQGRRASEGKVGGLSDAPVFKAAAAAAAKSPIWLGYFNAGAAVGAFKAAFPEGAALGLPADRAVSVSCGHRARSYSCELDVPVGLVAAAYKASRAGAPGVAP